MTAEFHETKISSDGESGTIAVSVALNGVSADFVR